MKISREFADFIVKEHPIPCVFVDDAGDPFGICVEPKTVELRFDVFMGFTKWLGEHAEDMPEALLDYSIGMQRTAPLMVAAQSLVIKHAPNIEYKFKGVEDGRN